MLPTTKTFLLTTIEAAIEALIAEGAHIAARDALDRMTARVTRAAGEAALAARFPSSEPPKPE